MTTSPPLSPELLIWAYQNGILPMARSRKGPIDWYCPDPRAILPLDDVRFTRSLRKRVRREDYRITFNQAFNQVIRSCAMPRPYADETWINDEIIDAYTQLHELGLAHSVEAWGGDRHEGTEAGRHEGAEEEEETSDLQLVGGLYGVSLGGAFFGESMFSLATDASKVCLFHLVERLRQTGFTLLDVQYSNPHIEQFGLVEIPLQIYMKMLSEALQEPDSI